MTSVAVRDPGGLELLADLEKAGAITPTSLDLSPETTRDQWEALGEMFGTVHRSACWLIGDWLNFGADVYGEEAAQFDLGLAPQTLLNYSSVARRVNPSRRRATVPFSSHVLVAALPPREQDAWLRKAEAGNWSRRELKLAMEGLPPVVGAETHKCPDCGYEHLIQT